MVVLPSTKMDPVTCSMRTKLSTGLFSQLFQTPPVRDRNNLHVKEQVGAGEESDAKCPLLRKQQNPHVV